MGKRVEEWGKKQEWLRVGEKWEGLRVGKRVSIRGGKKR